MAGLEVKIEDNSQKIKEELNKAIEQVLFAWGTTGVEACVKIASDIDSVTGRPTVDTGRYRAGFGFITPEQGKMSGTPTTSSEPTDNFASQRAQKDTVIIANNVEYAPYLEFGTGTQEGGHHARHIMRRALDVSSMFMRKDAEQILKGEKFDMSVSGIGGGK